MTVALDYAQAFEQDRRRRSLKYAGVLAVWTALLVVRPRLALTILREREA